MATTEIPVLSQDLIYLVMQFLGDEKYNETRLSLQKESGLHFSMENFEELVLGGKWEEAENYLSGFTKVDDNRHSMRIYFELRKQKYLEALDGHDKGYAVDILTSELKAFSHDQELFKNLTQLVTLNNFRENPLLSAYKDAKTARANLFAELKKLVEANPLLHDKLKFPNIQSTRLRYLVNQSLNWQHSLCSNPNQTPDVKTLFMDHHHRNSTEPNTQLAMSNQVMSSALKTEGYLPMFPNGTPFQYLPRQVHTPFDALMSTPSSMSNPAVAIGGASTSAVQTPLRSMSHPVASAAGVTPTPMGQSSLNPWVLTPSNMSNQPVVFAEGASTSNQTPLNPRVPLPTPSSMIYPLLSSGVSSAPAQTPLRGRVPTTSSITHTLAGPATSATISRGIVDSDNMLQARLPAVPERTLLTGSSSQSNSFQYYNDEVPKIVVSTLNQGSMVTSMDFNPKKQTLLLVGTNKGEISLWEVSTREKLFSRNFTLWGSESSSIALKAALAKDPHIFVKRILWCPESALIGVAFSKHIVQLYSCHNSPSDIRPHLELDAHTGAVNDIAFSYPNNQKAIITCGDDRTIKVWDAFKGAKLSSLENQEDAVYSLLPQTKIDTHLFFSTSVDGKIKAWLYGLNSPKINYINAPGNSSMAMAYSADGQRLFSCGTSKRGDSYLVEWNEAEGTLKRSYQGFDKPSLGIVQFGVIKNRFLAAGDDHSIKIWDMDNSFLLTTLDAEGGLPATPRICINKEGCLLAVSTTDNKVKILATPDGLRLMRETQDEIKNSKTSKPAPDGPAKNVVISIVKIKTDSTEEAMPNYEISAPAQLRSLKLSHDKANKILRLIYTKSGNTIVALASNATHLVWRWQQDELNESGKATTKVSPHLVQPASGILMINDLTNGCPDEAVPCFALSNNDSYVMSTSGGKISLFNMITFKTMATFMATPPVVTCLAFNPIDNNVIAIGMDNATINIYNVQIDKVISQLKGHSLRITGLAFSPLLKILVSVGADAQIIEWSSANWERQKASFWRTPAGRTCGANPRIQFHQDQSRMLAVSESRIAIFEMEKLEWTKQWAVAEGSALISHATFSCDYQMVYSSFLDGTVRIFNTEHLQLLRQINQSAYNLQPNPSEPVSALAVAAHPNEANQFAIGMGDGSVYVIEPLESDGKWDLLKLIGNASSSGMQT